MGCSIELICHDCRTQCFLGYGGYTSWVWPDPDEKEFEKNWLRLSEENRRLAKNLNVRWAVEKHRGHNFVAMNEDMLDYDGVGERCRKEYAVERPPHKG